MCAFFRLCPCVATSLPAAARQSAKRLRQRDQQTPWSPSVGHLSRAFFYPCRSTPESACNPPWRLPPNHAMNRQHRAHRQGQRDNGPRCLQTCRFRACGNGSVARQCRGKRTRRRSATRTEYHLHHLVVDCIQRRHIEKPAADARLIGRDNDAKTALVQSRNRLDRAWNRFPLGGGLDELRAIDIDHAVAIEDDQFQSGIHGVILR